MLVHCHLLEELLQSILASILAHGTADNQWAPVLLSLSMIHRKGSSSVIDHAIAYLPQSPGSILILVHSEGRFAWRMLLSCQLIRESIAHEQLLQMKLQLLY